MALDSEYLRPAEWGDFYDRRRLLQLLSDTGTPIPASDLTNEVTDGYKAAMKLIVAASAKIDARCQVGRRYTRADLEGFAAAGRVGVSTGADAKRFSLLQQLVADQAWGILLTRRGYSAQAIKEQAPRYADSELMLEQLYQGAAVFDDESSIAASVPSVVTIGGNNLRGTDFNRMFGVWPHAKGEPGFGFPTNSWGGYY